MWKETICSANSPIVTEEWNKKINYWKRVVDALDGIYNDHTPLDEIDSSSDDFWPKMRENVNVDVMHSMQYQVLWMGILIV